MMRPLRLLFLVFIGLLPAAAWALARPRFPGPQPHARPGANGVGGYEYETRYFRQRLDHFSFPGVGDEDKAAAFFQQRYLVGRGAGWAGPGGPIFFYCGNEGDIAWFAANSGLVWEAAPRFAALVVFAEAIILPPLAVLYSSSASCYFFFRACRFACVLQHRYYGESMPFGSKTKAYNNSKSLAYLTAEQAIADFAVLLTDLKRNLSAEGSPVVLFGGSYGGSKNYLELFDYVIDGALVITGF